MAEQESRVESELRRIRGIIAREQARRGEQSPRAEVLHTKVEAEPTIEA
jgi:hypothetical protein